MDADRFGEIFPLAETAELETIEWLLSVAAEKQVARGGTIVETEEWGNAAYLLIKGWVKWQERRGDKTYTLAVIGQGDFFGEMAILDESLRDTEVVAITAVEVLEIPAQRFLQLLFKDPQLNHRFFQRSMQRLRKLYKLQQLQRETCLSRLAYLLADLAESYGSDTGEGVSIPYLAPQDLADLAHCGLEETNRVLEKMQEKHWLHSDRDSNLMIVHNPRQLAQLFSH
ncbi:MAG: Crp/Fnr family transcriptional regulator [Pseudanabaenaceae cyanobacterium SKYGB_i_bin29]|nr:Crp/Fnr family transcriptional regulator [Pseudanabaenaceae cyanobacterium SKYG29]MDW8420863.1 Crp/Fnr family transcriptional regulator [Pseudanabaenaceae cyanobacterium SKYGB_i_bin29]